MTPKPTPAAGASRAESPSIAGAEPEALKVGRKFEYQIDRDLLGSFPVQLARVELASRPISVADRAGRQIWLAVDDHAPRSSESKQVTVSDLLNEDVELAPGGHRLTAFSVAPLNDETASNQMEIHTHDFYLDVEPGGRLEELGCIAFTPELTKNGPLAAKTLSFWAIPLAADIDQVRYEVVGPGLHRRSDAPPATEMIVEGPPSGDLRLSVHCFSDGRERGYDVQVVTINGDASSPEESE